MRSSAINFTALDLGSSKIALLGTHLDSRKYEVTVSYQGIFHSSGIKAGIIDNFKQTESSIENAIYYLEQEMGRNIKSISISLSGANTKSYFVHTKIPLETGQVTRQDLEKLINKSIDEFKLNDLVILHYFPVEYTLDQHNKIQNPDGMFGNSLGCTLHFVTANKNQISNVLNCFNKCNIHVSDIVLSVYVSALACLTEDEKSLGSIVIDFGARTTSFAVFFGSQMIYTGYVPIGSFHITSDIARILSISTAAAEKLKVLYGSAVIESESNTLINFNEIEPNHSPDEEINISPSDLSMIISARVEEILELIKFEYDKLDIDYLISRRIVLTGGASQLRGLREPVSRIFQKQARVGQPQKIPGFTQDHSLNSYTATLGILKYQMIKSKKLANSNTANNSVTGKILSWVKENI